jgi:hypothetical protein
MSSGQPPMGNISSSNISNNNASTVRSNAQGNQNIQPNQLPNDSMTNDEQEDNEEDEEEEDDDNDEEDDEEEEDAPSSKKKSEKAKWTNEEVCLCLARL